MKALSLSDFSGGVSEQLASQSFEATTVSEAVGFIPDGATALRSQWALERLVQQGNTIAIRGFSTDSKDYLVAIKDDGTVWYGVADELQVNDLPYQASPDTERSAGFDVVISDNIGRHFNGETLLAPKIWVKPTTHIEGELTFRMSISEDKSGDLAGENTCYLYGNVTSDVYKYGLPNTFSVTDWTYLTFNRHGGNFNFGNGYYDSLVDASDASLTQQEWLTKAFPNPVANKHYVYDPQIQYFQNDAFNAPKELSADQEVWHWTGSQWMPGTITYDGLDVVLTIEVIDAGVNYDYDGLVFEVPLVYPDVKFFMQGGATYSAAYTGYNNAQYSHNVVPFNGSVTRLKVSDVPEETFIYNDLGYSYLDRVPREVIDHIEVNHVLAETGNLVLDAAFAGPNRGYLQTDVDEKALPYEFDLSSLTVNTTSKTNDELLDLGVSVNEMTNKGHLLKEINGSTANANSYHVDGSPAVGYTVYYDGDTEGELLLKWVQPTSQKYYHQWQPYTTREQFCLQVAEDVSDTSSFGTVWGSNGTSFNASATRNSWDYLRHFRANSSGTSYGGDLSPYEGIDPDQFTLLTDQDDVPDVEVRDEMGVQLYHYWAGASTADDGGLLFEHKVLGGTEKWLDICSQPGALNSSYFPDGGCYLFTMRSGTDPSVFNYKFGTSGGRYSQFGNFWQSSTNPLYSPYAHNADGSEQINLVAVVWADNEPRFIRLYDNSISPDGKEALWSSEQFSYSTGYNPIWYKTVIDFGVPEEIVFGKVDIKSRNKMKQLAGPADPTLKFICEVPRAGSTYTKNTKDAETGAIVDSQPVRLFPERGLLLNSNEDTTGDAYVVFEDTTDPGTLLIETMQNRYPVMKEHDHIQNVWVAESDRMPHANVGTMWGARLFLGDVRWYNKDIEVEEDAGAGQRTDEPLSASNTRRYVNALWASDPTDPFAFEELSLVVPVDADSRIVDMAVVDVGLVILTSTAGGQAGLVLLRGTSESFRVEKLRELAAPRRVSTQYRPSGDFWSAAGLYAFVAEDGGIWTTNGNTVDRIDGPTTVDHHRADEMDHVTSKGDYLFASHTNRLLCMRKVGDQGAWTELQTMKPGYQVHSMTAAGSGLYFIQDNEIYRFDDRGIRGSMPQGRQNTTSFIEAPKFRFSTGTIGMETGDGLGFSTAQVHRVGFTLSSKLGGQIHSITSVAGPALDDTAEQYKFEYTKYEGLPYETTGQSLGLREEEIVNAGIGFVNEASACVEVTGDVTVESVTFYVTPGAMDS